VGRGWGSLSSSNQTKNVEDKYWKKLWTNVNMSATSGSAGARVDSNPKLKGRIRKGNQSTSRHDLDITLEDLKEQWAKQDGKCYWLNINMSLEDLLISRSPFAPSVDRIDSSRGYHKDNIVLTTRFANLGRGAYDRDDFKPRLDGLLSNR
jgi:hypothetical protein